MKKYIFILIIITILACGDKTSVNIESDDTEHHELTAPDTSATPVNVIK